MDTPSEGNIKYLFKNKTMRMHFDPSNFILTEPVFRNLLSSWSTIVLLIFMPHQYLHQLHNKLFLRLRLFLEKMVLAEVRFICLHWAIRNAQSSLSYIPDQEIYSQQMHFVNVGAQKLARIREIINFFRSELQKMGFEVLGDNDSPVMPIMLYNPAKIPTFSREYLKRNVRTIVFTHPHALFSFISDID